MRHFKPTLLLYSFFAGLLVSCISTLSPVDKPGFRGVIKTCTIDSTALTSDTLVTLIEETGERKSFKNTQCNNWPAYAGFPEFWPSRLVLDFRKKSYFFLHSPRATDTTIHYGSRDFSVTFMYDAGRLSYSKKKKTLILYSDRFNWSRVFITDYNPTAGILRLSRKKTLGAEHVQLDKKTLAQISCSLVLSSGLTTKKDPRDSIHDFEIKNKNEVVVYATWNYLPLRELEYKVRWTGPDGSLLLEQQRVFRPVGPEWYTWQTYYMNEKTSPEGKIRIQVYLNNSLVKEEECRFYKKP